MTPVRWVSSVLAVAGVLVCGGFRWDDVSFDRSFADRVNLDDLVPYTRPPAAWSDRHSDIAATWNSPNDRGIQRLESVVGWGSTKITDNLLSWTLSEEGRNVPLKLEHRNFRPDKVVESDESEDLGLTATAAFPERMRPRNLASR